MARATGRELPPLRGYLMVMLVLATTMRTTGVAGATEKPPVPASPRVIVVLGAAGADQYGEQFAGWAERLKEVAGEAEAELVSIGGPGDGENEIGSHTDREQLQQAVQASQPAASSPLWVFLIGHGTFAQQTAKFNLHGPDVSAAELAEWLEPIERPVVVVNAASASGPFINRLSAPGRVIVTATQSGQEQNFARFGDYFSRAIGNSEADLDHDDQVSVLEAFLRASREVQRYYEGESRLATEHALLDDNGDRRGTPAPMYRGARPSGEAKEGEEIDGNAARRLTLAPASATLPLTEQEIAQRRSLEQQLDQLRSQKPQLGQEAYDKQLEPLLLKLARLYRAAERRQESE